MSARPFLIWRWTTSRQVSSRRLPTGDRMISRGIRYSNIDPDHDNKTASLPTGVKERPSRNQCLTGTSPLAMAMKLNSRASEARRSYHPGSRLHPGRVEQEAEFHRPDDRTRVIRDLGEPLHQRGGRRRGTFQAAFEGVDPSQAGGNGVAGIQHHGSPAR